MHVGVYSDDGIRRFIEEGIVDLGDDSEIGSRVQPSSLDLRIDGRFYCLPYSSVPPRGEGLEDYFRRIANYDFDILGDQPGFLHRGSVYVVKLQEGLLLPEHISARANPKSSTGRIDLHARLVAENSVSFDDVPVGYNGGLWLELTPRSFDVKLKAGECLNQLRFMDRESQPLSGAELLVLNRDCGIAYDLSGERMRISDLLYKGAAGMTASVGDGLVGYIARRDAPPVDLSKRDLPASRYFHEVHSRDGSFVVSPDSFYILNSREVVCIPNSTCAEMIDIDTGMGEFRGHYAGFFDPAFHAQPVLELRNYGQPFLLRDGQVISGLNYFRMKSKPSVDYGSKELETHYQGQKGPRLAKFFDMEK